jgi:riboflavin synthase
MFTGLVEARGTVREIVREGPAVRLSIAVPEPLAADGCAIGDSIAINGCCLTVVSRDAAVWSFRAGEETLAKTNLGDLVPGSPVNLERALLASARLGGHLVQGHVDGVGRVDRIERNGEWTDMWFHVPADLAAPMVPKGSVTVDGVSLTLVHVESERFGVALIPHTLEATTLGVRNVGDRVNVETDVLGKYVWKFMQTMHEEP